MKYVSMVILFTLFSAGISFAQEDFQRRGPQGPPPLPTQEELDGIVKELVWELTLSDDQAKKFEKVFRTHMEDMVVMREEQEKMQREKMEEVRKNFEEDLSGILNEAQMKKFKAIHPRKDQRQKNPGMRGEEGAKPGCRGKHDRNHNCRK